MRPRRITEGDRSVHLLVFDPGDEVKSTLVRYAKSEGITAALVQGIGALSRATVAWWNSETLRYEEIDLREQVEVLSIQGNIGLKDGEPIAHLHITLGRRDGSAVGGHLVEGRCYPTLEVFVETLPTTIERTRREDTGLDLIAR